jgi:hypothetical protein
MRQTKRFFPTLDVEFPLPKTFEGKKQWKGLLTPVLNQGECGSCWAYATTACLADRFNIQSEGKLHLQLSPVRLILCDDQGYEKDLPYPSEDIETVLEFSEAVQNNFGCRGNTILDAWRYLYIKGTVTEQCVPQRILLGKTKPEQIPICMSVTGPTYDMCADYNINSRTHEESGTPARFFRCAHYYAIAGVPKDRGSEFNIREYIYRYGPVTTALKIYENFYTFDPKKSIYRRGSTFISGHAVILDGWGEEGGVKFWWARNSWGPKWGIHGYFKLLRGINECECEENVVVGIPDFFYPASFFPAYEWQESLEDFENRRFMISNFGGGVDPATGFSRRVLSRNQYKSFIKPLIELDELPNFRNFIAGKVKSKTENFIFMRSKNKRWYVLFVVLLVLFVIFVTGYYAMKTNI